MSKLQETHKDSPYRCQGKGQGPEAQCNFLSMEGMVVEGKNYFNHDLELVKGISVCPRCGGVAKVEARRRERVSVYKINALQDRLVEQIQSGQIKNLRNEIGLTRLMVEETFNLATTDSRGAAFGIDLYQPKIERLLARVESLVNSCQRIEDKSESQLDPTEANKFAMNLMKIAMKFVPEGEHEAFAEEIDKLLI